jgi:hypothetical protein
MCIKRSTRNASNQGLKGRSPSPGVQGYCTFGDENTLDAARAGLLLTQKKKAQQARAPAGRLPARAQLGQHALSDI